MAKLSKLKWGIIGTGKIAGLFAHDLLLVEDAVFQGVASREGQKSKAFAEKYQAAKYYSSYEQLAEDPDIDIVYIATPHVFHFPHAMLCLQHNKHVLCEKPFGMNQREVLTLTREAKARGLFVMEALWTRFLPSTQKLLELVQQDVIGKVDYLRADFGFQGDPDPDKRLLKKALGGGSLLDIGIYPAFLSLLLMGEPDEIKARARFSATGVDTLCTMIFHYHQGKQAVLESTILHNTPTEAFIYGNKGFIKMHRSFHHTRQLTVALHHQPMQTLHIDYRGNGFCDEIEEVMYCVNNNQTESNKMTHQMSLNLITTLDRIRGEIGLSYPMDGSVDD